MKGGNRAGIKRRESVVENVIVVKPEEFSANLQNDLFIRLLLAENDISAIPKHIASALSLEDYYVNVVSSVLTDFHFNNLIFAAQHHFSPHATCVFMEEMEELRRLITNGSSVDHVAAVFKAQVLSHAMDPEPVLIVPVAVQEPELEEVKPPPKKGSKKGKPEPPPPPAPEPEPPPERVQFSVADVADLTEFSTFLMQHSKLFQFVFSDEVRQDVTPSRDLHVFINTCSPSLPLCKALREGQYLEEIAKRLAKEKAALVASETEEEHVQLDLKIKASARQDAEQLRLRELQIVHDHTIHISKDEVSIMVEAVKVDILNSFNARHLKVIERIEALSEKFK